MEKQYVIAIDTTTEALGVAVWCVNDGTACAFQQDSGRQQAQLLHATIQQLMEQIGATFQDVVCVVSTRGPGSFTGIRVGMAAAQGLATALSVPFVTVTTFEAYAHQNADQNMAIWVEAWGGDVYVQHYKKGVLEGEPEAMPVWKALEGMPEGLPFTGNGAHEHKDDILDITRKKPTVIDRFIDPKKLAEQGWNMLQNGDETPQTPLYVGRLNYRRVGEK